MGFPLVTTTVEDGREGVGGGGGAQGVGVPKAWGLSREQRLHLGQPARDALQTSVSLHFTATQKCEGRIGL
jgi:hypothetical protein